MRRKFTAGLLVGATTLTVAAVAWAVPASQTTLDVNFKPGSATAGTKKKPRGNSLVITAKGGTTTGTGQPATSTALNISLPKQWILNSERWPRKARCSVQRANQQKSASVCPKSSRIGGGKTIVQGGASETSEGARRTLTVKAFVVKNGDIGLFVQNKAGETPQVNEMIVGATSRQRKISVKISENLQEPLDNVPTGIRELTFSLKGQARINGKRRSIVETTGCGTRNQWQFTLQDIYRDGRKSDSDTARSVSYTHLTLPTTPYV